jgi:hypothetical protein
MEFPMVLEQLEELLLSQFGKVFEQLEQIPGIV